MENEDRTIAKEVSDLANAIKELATQIPFSVDGVKEYGKTLSACISHSLKDALFNLLRDEQIQYMRLEKASFITRWYRLKRYRKTKLSRILLERHIRNFKKEEGLC